jgi:hypothetical protein
LNGNLGKPPEEWRIHTTKHPLGSLRLRRDDLRKLHRILNSKQFEYRDRIIPMLARQESETEEQFSKRKASVFNSFITSVTIDTATGVMLTGNEEKFLDKENLPDNIKSIFFSTATSIRTINNFIPQCTIVVFLDFTQPPIFDFSRLPTLATQNESNFEIHSDSEGWFTSSNANLTEFFNSRATRTDWLHRGGIYDALLFVLGLPFAIWLCYRLGQLVETRQSISLFIRIGLYVYTFFLALNCFRFLFSYSRWVFPKVELEGIKASSPLRHRGTWAVILGAITAAFIYDVGKSFFGF